MPDGVAEQAAVVWANVQAILEEADMSAEDVVSVTTYVVAGEELGPVMAARDEALAGRLVASTLVTVPALARPEWRLEISLIGRADVRTRRCHRNMRISHQRVTWSVREHPGDGPTPASVAS